MSPEVAVKRWFLGVVLFAAVMLPGNSFAQNGGAQLRAAVFAGNASEVRRLAAVRANVNAANDEGVTPLMIACALGRTEIAEILLGSGAETELKTVRKRATALMFAADFGHIEAARLLVERNADVKALDLDGNSAVDYSVIANTGETEADGERVLAVGSFLADEGAPMRLKGADDLTIENAISDADRLKGLIDRARQMAASNPAL
jgi:hypothetical protein